MGRTPLLLATFFALAPACAVSSQASPCPLKHADGSAFDPQPQGYVCDYLNTQSPGALSKFSRLSIKDQQALLTKAAAAYATYQRQRDELLSQTRPDNGAKASATSLNQLKKSLDLLEQRGDTISDPFAANRPAYVREFAQRESELNQAIQKQEKGLGLKQQADLSKAASKFQNEAAGAGGALKTTTGALAQGQSAQEANGKLFDNSAGSSLRSGTGSGPSPELSGTAAGQVGTASTMYGKLDGVKPTAPGEAPSKSWTDSAKSFLHGQAADAEQSGADHLVEADQPGTPWYKRWYHETAAAGDAVRESVSEAAAGDSKPWKESGQYWSQKGAALNADADSLDENGWSGAKKFAEKGAAMGMLVTGHVTGNMPEYAQKTADFSGRLADGDGDAWKETGSAAEHAPVALVKGVYDSGKSAVSAWKQFGQLDSHTTTYNGLVATAKSVGFLGIFAVPAEGAAGTIAAKEGAEEVAVAAGKEAAEQTAATAAKETVATASASEGRAASETLLKAAAEKESATAKEAATASTPGVAQGPAPSSVTRGPAPAAAPAAAKPPPPAAAAPEPAPSPAPDSTQPAVADASAEAETAARAQARAQVLQDHMDGYTKYVRDCGNEPEELSPTDKKVFLDGYLSKEHISPDSPLAQEMDRTLALQEYRPPAPVEEIQVVQKKPVPMAQGPRTDAIEYISQQTDRLSTPQALEQTARDPNAYKSFANTLLRPEQTPEIVKLQEAFTYNNTRQVIASQATFKSQLLDGARQALKEEGLRPDQVLAHGTSSDGMLGMIKDGAIHSNNPHPGFSGESAHVYAGDMDTAAQYATRAPVRGQPAVLVLMKKSELQLSGDVLSGEPTLSRQVLGFVVTDGEKTTYISQQQAMSLNRSYKTWTDRIQEGLRSEVPGSGKELTEWEKLDERLTPKPTD